MSIGKHLTASKSVEGVYRDVRDAVVDGRLAQNAAFRFKTLESLFAFLNGSKEDLLDAAFADYDGSVSRTTLELEYTLALKHVADATQRACKPTVRSGPLPAHFTAEEKKGGVLHVQKPVGAVLILAREDKPLYDLFAPASSALLAGNVVCCALSPRLPALNAVLVGKMAAELPQNTLVFFAPGSEKEHAASSEALASFNFDIRIPGSQSVAQALASPGYAYLSDSFARNSSTDVWKNVGEELMRSAVLAAGRNVASPRFLLVKEDVLEAVQSALLSAAGNVEAIQGSEKDIQQLDFLLYAASKAGELAIVRPVQANAAPGIVTLPAPKANARFASLLSDPGFLETVTRVPILVLIAVSSTEHAFFVVENLKLNGTCAIYSHDEAEIRYMTAELASTFSINHLALDLLFSSYVPRLSSGALRWSPELFGQSARVQLQSVEAGSLLSPAPATRKALEKQINKTRRLVKASRAHVKLPLLRVFFLQGLFLFWGSVLGGSVLGGLYALFRVGRWAVLRYM
ncbi:uncharacterized protein PSFLO_00401 [Pseudozyma flocculosa]|uniref:Aldehyde dehydrogenase domain-containing protein n=2 Tax=Pseudozyma flocculosa TaxID=84751 RepID=A0A5C3ESV3_9BASI|nr:uncharacterized protein PSFLO_00401 [Pseudozyma flocculosa]